MPVTATERPTTFEEAAAFNPDECPGDLVRGMFVPGEPKSWRHGEIVVAIGAALGQYRRAHPGWCVAMGNPGVKLQHDTDTLRGPDIGVVSEERLPRGTGMDGWLEGAPDLAVEVRDDEPLSELLEKADEYLAAGGGMVWIVDPTVQRVHVVEPPDRIRVLAAHHELDGGELLPGFSCKVCRSSSSSGL